ncbi:hypothetical protein BAnh1_09410 [Bartonella australis AUST/NH1]|uniref:Uncharacterized protein n=1 Tax=Bartonella australis (strain Aust/NH1) TaxID=1094489 RepID=M1NU26_BARAA|nr:hypothetical protein [Bartonella australis]AGF74813.1 hypothetical protein BAnh1_09410 [Bartonella australis AUST/NH1]
MVKNYLLMMGAALAAFFMAFFKIFKLGREKERDRQSQADLKAAQIRLEVDHEIDQMDDNSVRSNLLKWVRDK